MKKLIVFACSFLWASNFLSAADTPVTVTWSPDTAGSYQLFEATKPLLPKPATTSGTYPLADGTACRLVGPGFDVNFSVHNSKIVFSQSGVLNGATGLRLDKATNTFSFVSVPIQLDAKNCDVTVSLSGIPSTQLPQGQVPTGPQTLNVVYGHHTLYYGGMRIGLNVDAHGSVTTQDVIPGITLHGSTIAVEGKPLEVTTTLPSWSIHNTNLTRVNAPKAIYLLPGTNAGYIFNGGKANVPFFLNDDGLLSLQAEGPYTEVISIKDKDGAETAKIMIPDGETKMAARLKQEKNDLGLHDKILTASAKAAWKKDFDLVEYMKIYAFPEEQLTYPIELPADVKPENLKLLAFTETAVHIIPFQLGADEKGNRTISFRAELPQGAKRTFRLVSGFDTAGIPTTSITAPTLQAGTDAHEAALSNDRLIVKIPAGRQDFAGGKPLSQVPAPILGIARPDPPQPWMATASFAAPDTLLVDSIDAKLIASGPLFAIYQIAYKLKENRSYTATLELRANEPEVRIGESLEGFTPEDGAALHLNYGKGALDPDQRLAGSNSGYDLFSGDYDRDAKEGKLNYAIGIFTPNGLGLMRSTAFYRQDGSDALLLSINRIRDWQTAKRATWSSSGAYENLRFYHVDERKFMTAGLSGAKRYWVLGLIPRDQVVLNVLPGDKSLGAGPESRLFNTLTFWSLNAYKDRMPDWEEKLDAAPFNSPGFLDFQYYKDYAPMSYDEYKKKFMENNTYFHDIINYSSNFGGYSDRAVPAYFAEYALNRASWTPEQRQEIRQFLLLLADYVEGDDNQPHHSMLSGHPNFVMDTKQAIPFAVATFPNHPRAKAWRDSYMEFYNEWLDKYERKDAPELNTKGGRWTENIACYVGQCFVGITPDQTLLKSFDGTSLTKDARLQQLIRWMRDSFMSPSDGVRLLPPEGAHSFNFEPDHIGRKVLFQLSAEMAEDAPELSQEMRWIETNGKEGKKPDVHSELFTDFGPVFHYDFGGPHESYAYLANINGMNYRWTGAGVVYYAAKNKAWSYNTAETTGDNTLDEISAFNVKGKGLTATPTDQLLYDFDFAQFYREPGAEGDAYVARGVMLLRDDYFVILDEVKNPTITGTFNWVGLYGLPQIYQLKPGAPAVEKTSRDPQPPHAGVPDRTAPLRSYTGQGDFLTVVAPDPVTATATSFGATVNGEYIFVSQSPENITQDKAVFSGNYGYARANQLALFVGTKIGLDGFELRREGGDFGISAAVEQNKIIGRVVGRSGGKISIVPPAKLNPAGASVTLDGQAIPHTVEDGAVTFNVAIAQKDGLKKYAITF